MLDYSKRSQFWIFGAKQKGEASIEKKPVLWVPQTRALAFDLSWALFLGTVWGYFKWNTILNVFQIMKEAFLKMCFIWYGPWLYFLNCNAINELMTFPKFLEKSC